MPFMYNTDVAVFYYCLLCMNSTIIFSTFVSCCHLANTNKNEYNHCCYLYSLGGRQLCQNFELNSLVTLNFDLESGVRVTWRGLPLCQFWSSKPLCCRLRPVVCDWQTDVRQKHRLMPCLLGVGYNNGIALWCWFYVLELFTSVFVHLFSHIVKTLTALLIGSSGRLSHRSQRSVARFFQFSDWFELLMELVIGFQHRAPDMVVHVSGKYGGN